MRKILLNIFRLYFRYFPVRKGKIPVMLLIDKTGLTKNFNVLSAFDNKININLNLDDWIQKQIFYFGRYEIEKDETLFWQHLIKEEDYVFDIGANIGYYSLQAAARIGKNGKVFAFEPVSSTYKKLIDNIKINSFANIIAENIAISNKEGEIELFVADELSTGSSSISMHVNFSGIKEKVSTIILDEYAADNNIKKVDVVKIDVEGCEPMVIEGMTKIMNDFKPLILIEVLDERLNTTGSSKEALYSLFEKNAYEPFEIKNYNTLRSIRSPKEGGLIVFKHRNCNFPGSFSIIY